MLLDQRQNMRLKILLSVLQVLLHSHRSGLKIADPYLPLWAMQQ